MCKLCLEKPYVWKTHKPSQTSPKPPSIPNSLHSPLLAELHSAFWKYVSHNLPAPNPQAPSPPLQTGYMVCLSEDPQGDLTPKWQGPFRIILLIPTAAKLKKVASWVYLSRLKRVAANPVLPSTDAYQVSLTGPTSLKITRRQPLSIIQEDTE